jgi:hypothetical protein
MIVRCVVFEFRRAAVAGGGAVWHGDATDVGNLFLCKRGVLDGDCLVHGVPEDSGLLVSMSTLEVEFFLPSE